MSPMVSASHAIATGIYSRQSSAILIFNYVGAAGLWWLLGAAPPMLSKNILSTCRRRSRFQHWRGARKQTPFKINIAGGGSSQAWKASAPIVKVCVLVVCCRRALVAFVVVSVGVWLSVFLRSVVRSAGCWATWRLQGAAVGGPCARVGIRRVRAAGASVSDMRPCVFVTLSSRLQKIRSRRGWAG